ncbi:MAG TPA: transcription initiation factor IIB [Nitrososphaeraceae archaeon]|nr:transcription initiation factor IIB [Nitrososphaeraceae archaeon]
MCIKNHVLITDNESGELICSNCGMVISEKTTDNAHEESRVFTLEGLNNRDRTGPPRSLAVHDMGLSTIIGRRNIDASGQLLNASIRSTIERLRTWDSRLQVNDSGNRGLRYAFCELDKMKDKLHLTDTIIEKAAYIYRKAQQRGMVRGRTILGILAAAVYIACREMQTFRTLNDIADTTSVTRKEIARNFRTLIFELNIRSPAIDPMKCITKIAHNANITERTKREAMKLMAVVVRKELSAGKEPMGLAATVLYISCKKAGENKSQLELARASGVTDVTIRNRFNHLKYMLDAELN